MNVSDFDGDFAGAGVPGDWRTRMHYKTQIHRNLLTIVTVGFKKRFPCVMNGFLVLVRLVAGHTNLRFTGIRRFGQAVPCLFETIF